MTRQRIAITGSSGMIGGALSAYLRDRGDEVVRLVRRHPVAPLEARLPAAPEPSEQDVESLAAALRSVDALVNLAGAGIGDHRWTSAYKRSLWNSRIDTTQLLVAALARVDHPVRVVSGSAIGYYGDRGEEILDETSAPGSGFLVELTEAWEAAALAAESSNHPVALARTGLVVSAQGGAFQRLALATRLGAGGPLGSGRQWWSWISLRDEVRALAHLVDTDVRGPVDLTAPRASRQIDLARALGRSMRRPALLPAPTAALKVVLGEMSGEVLASARVRPRVLEDSGFTWLDSNQDQLLDRLAADVTGRATR